MKIRLEGKHRMDVKLKKAQDIESIEYKKLIIDILDEINNVTILRRIYMFITQIKKAQYK